MNPLHAWFAALTLSAACLSAQSRLALVEVLNTTPHQGVAVADVVVPLARGKLHKVPALITDAKRVCQVAAMGARWPDGSLRYLRVGMPVQVKANQRRTVQLFEHTGAIPGFVVHPKVAAAGNVRAWFWANDFRTSFPAPKLLESGPAFQLHRSRLRVAGTSIWAELTIVLPSGQPHGRFYLAWGNSDPSNPFLSEWVDQVELELGGVRVELEHPGKVLGTRQTRDGVGVMLHRYGPIADGQAQCLEGRLSFAGQAPRVRAIARGWAESQAFGPFGELFPESKVSAVAFADMIAEDRKAQIDGPWARAVHGCNPDPRNTGNQRDFGVVVMRPDVLRADPGRLSLIARSVFQEYCRPTHFRDRDVSRVRRAKHPKLLTLGGRPHFRSAKWVDLLGKPGRYLLSHEIARDPSGRRFQGHDDQHLSINFLCAYALTTGDRMARLECEHQVELWLSEFTIDSGTYNDKPRAARATGRSLLAGCWLWLVTGRADLRKRIEQRSRNIVQRLTKPRHGVAKLLPGVLVPRSSSRDGVYWAPWEEALAVTGLNAVAQLFGVPEAMAVAKVVSTNLVRHGIGVTPSGWRVGYFLPFHDDHGRPYVALTDPLFASVQAAGRGLTRWSLPAVLFAARYTDDPWAAFMANTILHDLLSDPKFLGHPDLLKWMGVLKR